jgi:RNA-binding protein 39
VKDESTFSKDQRTVFVSQLVMRATEKDIRRYFRRKVGCKVKEVILLKDKRTGNHKGCAYIEMQRVEDVNKAVAVAGLPPDFQRFPILTKASEAEKNYVIPASSSVITASMIGSSAAITPFLTQDGKVVQSQKVYVGGLDPSVSEEHLFALFSQFGQLEKVNMQIDPTTKNRRGFAFLSFKDPKVGNLAIKTMSNQFLAGRSLKTGWASQSHPIPGIDIVESDELPENSEGRAQMAFAVLAQLTGTSTSGQSASGADSAKSGSMTWSVGTSVDSSQAESVLTSSAGEAKVVIKDLPSGVTKIKNEVRIPANAAAIDTIGNVSVGSSTVSGKPSRSILAHNMFDKDKETENGWANDLKEEFTEECSKFGKLMSVTVMSTEEGGKIYATFETRDAASTCASNLAGRWFDKRQLRIEFVDDADVPS